MKACLIIVINFSKFTNALIRKEKKNTHIAVNEKKKKLRKVGLCHYIISVPIRSFSCPYSATFGLNTERYSEYEQFSRSVFYNRLYYKVL